MTLRRMTDPVRSIVFNIAFYLCSVLYFLLVIVTVLMPSHKPVRMAVRYYCKLSLFLARWIMGIRFEWRGTEMLPPEGTPIILAAAHQSYVDPMLAYACREDVTALAKKELFATPFVGALISKMGVIKVDRQKGGATESMDQVAKTLNREGRMIIIYPQATRVRPGGRRRLKSGAYVLAKEGGFPAFTVASNSGALWSRGFWHHSGTCVFEICRKIPKGLDKDSFMRIVEDDVVERSDALAIEAGFADLVAAEQARIAPAG